MADNLTTTTTVSTIPASTVVATRAVTYSGDPSAHIAPTGLVVFSGSDDAKAGLASAAPICASRQDDGTGFLCWPSRSGDCSVSA